MALIADLLTRVSDEFPATPGVVAQRALSDAVKEFCSRSHAWQDMLSQVIVIPGTATYDLDVDTGTQIVALVEVRLAGVKLDPVANELFSQRRTLPAPGKPTKYTQTQPTSLELDRAPIQRDVLTAKAALTLSLGATNTTLPDSLLDEYGEAIASGAKMRLVRQANQPWYAPDAALGYAGPFYTAITQAKGRAMATLGEADLSVQMVEW